MTPTLAELAVAPVQVAKTLCTLYQGTAELATPAVTGGSVTADSRRAILRDASLEFAVESEAAAIALWDLLTTPGVIIGLARGFVLPDGSEVMAQLGRFIADSPEIKRSSGGLSLSVGATDVAIKIQRARWTDPYQIVAGTTLATALMDMLTNRYPGLATNITANNCPETMGAGLVTEAGDGSDPWADAVNLATAYGYALYPDTSGVVTVRKISSPVPGNVFTFARGETSIITETTLASPLEQTYNGVIASAEGSEVASPVRGEAWDANPSSPTYYLGPFGKVPYFYSSSLMTTVDQCESAAAKILAEHIGRVESFSFSSAVHPGLQPLDVVGIEQADGSVKSHIIDSLTIPLEAGGTMQAVAREVRVDY